jgi:hypothetical protein
MMTEALCQALMRRMRRVWRIERETEMMIAAHSVFVPLPLLLQVTLIAPDQQQQLD